MTEALFSISNAGILISKIYYKIAFESVVKELISDELIKEVLMRSSDQEGKDWNFTFNDLQVEIIKKLEYKIEFFVSWDISSGDCSRQWPLYH
jgi:hypothetical protein